MNDEPAWLRNDAASRTRDIEHENVTPEAARKRAGRPQGPGVEAEASRALAAGQPDKLRPGAVLHLQRAAGNAGVARLLGGDREPESPVKEVVGHGAGVPLDEASRGRMEASFGADFSDVRVHTGSSAAASARAVDAHAYTVGNEIVLGDGQTPGSPAGERTLAHELTHVVQQRSGPVDGTPTTGGISVSDPADRFERAAETTADAVMSTGRAGAVPGGAGGSSVQRERQEEEPQEAPQEVNRPEEEPQQVQRPEEEPQQVQRPEEEREEVQQLAIQREEAPEDEQETEEDEGAVQELAIQRDASDMSSASSPRP
jgi:hypothetical protein